MVESLAANIPLVSLVLLIALMIWDETFRPTLGVILLILTMYTMKILGHIHLSVDEFIHISDTPIIVFLAAMILIFWAIEKDLIRILKKYFLSKVNSLSQLATILILTSAILSALLDEVDAIILPTLIILALYKEKVIDKEEVIKLTILSILAANSGSIMLQIGNPVSLIFGRNLGIGSLEHLIVMLPIGILEIILVLWFSKMFLKDREIKIHLKKPTISLAEWFRLAAFVILAILLIFKEPLAHYLHINPEYLIIALAWSTVSVIILTLSEEQKKKTLNEWGVEIHSLIGLWVLLALAGFVREYSSLGEILASLIQEIPFKGIAMLGLTAAITSHLDNVVAIAIAINVMASIKKIYWEALLGSVLGGNLTTIGSTANIVALSMLKNRGLEVSYLDWLKKVSLFALFQLIIGMVALKLWLFVLHII